MLDVQAILKLQERYAAAILAKGDLPSDILAKYQRMQELAERFDRKEINLHGLTELVEIAGQLLPYLHFRVDDVNWTEQ